MYWAKHCCRTATFDVSETMFNPNGSLMRMRKNTADPGMLLEILAFAFFPHHQRNDQYSEEMLHLVLGTFTSYTKDSLLLSNCFLLDRHGL